MQDKTTSETIKLDVFDKVALITLNRPDQLNAISTEMGQAFDDVMAKIGTDSAIRAIVITGAGRAFCAGADVRRLTRFAETGGKSRSLPRPGEGNSPLDVFSDVIPELRTRYLLPMAVQKPVIAAINGPCVGIALALAAACDIRFAAAPAYFSAIFPQRGLIAEGALAWTLPNLIGRGLASDILMSGRRVSAEEALRMGLVSMVYSHESLLDETLKYAANVANNCSPRSTRVIKKQLLQTQSQTLQQAILMAHDETVASLESADFREGVAAFKAGRTPMFGGN